MTLQPNEAGPLSVIFAIDSGRDWTPNNDPGDPPDARKRQVQPAGPAQLQLPGRHGETPDFRA